MVLSGLHVAWGQEAPLVNELCNRVSHFQQEEFLFSVMPASALFPFGPETSNKGLSHQGDNTAILRFWGLLQNIVHPDQGIVLTLSV